MSDIMGKIYVNNYKLCVLDTGETAVKYRLITEKQDLEIGESTKKLIEYIEEMAGESIDKIINEYSEKNSIDIQILHKICGELQKREVIINYYPDKKEITVSNFEYRKTMEYLWFTKKLIDVDANEEKFQFFKIFFDKKAVFLTMSFIIIMNTVFLLLNIKPELYKNEIRYFSGYDYFIVFILGQFLISGFHEIGHTAASKLYNTKMPRGIGIGIYYIFIVFYADTHESWSLPRKERKIISLAGFYFSMIMQSFFIVCFILSGSAALRDYILLFYLSITGIFNPFLKMDGYWFLSDALGITNLKAKSVRFLREVFEKAIHRGKKIEVFKNYSKLTQNIIHIYIIMFGLFNIFLFAVLVNLLLGVLFEINNNLINKFVLITNNFGRFGEGEIIMAVNDILRNILILFGGTIYIFANVKSIINMKLKKE